MIKNEDMPAMPQSGFCTIDGDVFVSAECGGAGLTKREQCCLKMGVPETGDAVLDGVIRKGNRQKFAAMAMQGLCSADCDVPLPPDLVAMRAIEYADALLVELEKPQ